MNILDRYTTRLFVKIYLVAMICMMGLWLVVDLVKNFDKLTPRDSQSISMIDVLGQYYGARLLVLFNNLSPIIVLIAVISTISLIRSRNEMVALQSSGVSPLRTTKPLIIASIIIALLTAGNREFGIPLFQSNLSRSALNWRGTEKEPISATFDHKTDILIGGQYAVLKNKTIIKPRFHLHRRLGAFPRVIESESALYLEATNHHPEGYLLKNVIKPVDISNMQSVQLAGVDVIITPSEETQQNWLAKTDLFVVSSLPFEALVMENTQFQFSSMSQLRNLLKNESLDYGANLRVQLHARLVEPILDLTLLLLGLPLILSRKPKKLVISVALGSLIVVLFFGVIITCHALGSNSSVISPSLAAWLPLIILSPVAYFNGAAIW
ncbi:MAG: LptF/LptG family permease [Planctomycetaceae bacterium]|jgi:lipopolysaccharide export system permease protein|nr:LptF/LptG family permease [Planctomycetaceae bacterium]